MIATFNRCPPFTRGAALEGGGRGRSGLPGVLPEPYLEFSQELGQGLLMTRCAAVRLGVRELARPSWHLWLHA
ncbi:MAG: hypothetical protein ABR573_10010 [Candidatus Dormibacteria bacterium]